MGQAIRLSRKYLRLRDAKGLCTVSEQVPEVRGKVLEHSFFYLPNYRGEN